MHALKIESTGLDTSFADAIVKTLTNFAKELGYRDDRIDTLECRRRDGFIPHSNNLGGIQCVAFTDQCMAEMEGTGFKNADNTLEEYRKMDVERFLADRPSYPKREFKWSNEQCEEFDELRRNDSEATVLFSMDCMYEGMITKTRHQINLRLCVCVKDSPYHRQYDDMINIDVTFVTIAGLKRQLDKILKRDNVKMFASNLTEAY